MKHLEGLKKSERENLTTRLHPQLKEAALKRAAEERQRMADIIEVALIAYLSSPKAKAS